MPEGHTIHHLAGRLNKKFAGLPVEVSSPQGRFSDGASRLHGAIVRAAEAHGKHLLCYFEQGDVELTLHVHLGLYGRTRFFRGEIPEPRGAVRLRMVGRRGAFDLVGPTKCEVLDPSGLTVLRARLGADPIREDYDIERLWTRIQRTRRSIAAVLMDQSMIAGIGNVYRAEILFLCGLDPYMPARDLTREQFESVWETTKVLLRLGAKENRIRTIGTAAAQGVVAEGLEGWTVRGRYGERPDKLFVYKRPTCKVCLGDVHRAELVGRTLYWCPSCQPTHAPSP